MKNDNIIRKSAVIREKLAKYYKNTKLHIHVHQRQIYHPGKVRGNIFLKKIKATMEEQNKAAHVNGVS